MRVQDFIAEETMRAMEAVIHQTKRLPEDKLTWSPLEEGRSALDQIAECAVIAGFYPMVLSAFKLPPIDEEAMKQFQEMKAQFETLDKAEAELRKNTAATCEAIRAVPDDKLSEEMAFFGPEPWKVAWVMNGHAWNMHYHTGQICYLQTLLGDKEMG